MPSPDIPALTFSPDLGTGAGAMSSASVGSAATAAATVARRALLHGAATATRRADAAGTAGRADAVCRAPDRAVDRVSMESVFLCAGKRRLGQL